MKYILVIGDGMADHPLDTLGGRTPLEASKKDAIDALARHGILGSVRNVPEGFAPGSDTAIMSIFGCSPRKYFFGRAPLEAAASGIRLAPGDACYRCNMVTYADEDVPFEHKHIISHSAGSIEGRESDELVTMLFDHPDFRPLAEQAGMVIHKGSSFRHLAVQSHVDIKGIQLAPPHDHLGEEIGPILPTGCPNADVLRELMRRAFDILDQHPINVARRAAGKLPANGVWFWAEGTAAALPNFPEHYGSDGGVVSAVPLCHGIGILTGLEAVTVPTATGEWDTDYAAKVAAALGVLKKHDFVALHLEGPDEATHNHDLEHKIYSIERLSADVVAPVTEALRAAGEDFRLLLLSDHMTYMANGAHGADPVPFVLYDSRVSEGSGLPYSEANGRKGPYVDDGAELMDLLFELKKTVTGTTTEAAWAKLNLSLDVLGARSDGFHDLRMVMQSVDLHDDVTVTLDDTGVCRAETNRSYLPCGADNVAVRAAQVFLARAGLKCGVHIRLHKRIPVCAGLGGGSSDAAAVLRALERLTGAGFTRAELEEMGAQVGSDVPYCVAGGTMLAEGRGERLTPVTPMPRMPVVICKPDFPISTPELFHRVDARTSRCHPDTEGICAALADGDMPRLARRMYNVFEDVLTHREGEIAAIKSRLLDGGALGAVMSGTGSAVFGIFADADSAAYAKRRLARDYAECFLTETIGRLEI